MSEKYLVTGNEVVSLPTIRESDGSLEGISFLHMGCKGMLEMCGDTNMPFLRPFVEVNGERITITNLNWKRVHYWIPTFEANMNNVILKGTLLAPLKERGFCYRIEVKNIGEKKQNIRFGLEGRWTHTLHSINESKLIDSKKNVYESGWNHSVVFDLRVGYSLFAFAPIYTEDPETSDTKYSYYTNPDGSVDYTFYQETLLGQNMTAQENFWFGLGFEEVAAATSAKEMLRQGFDAEYDKTCRWLSERERHTDDSKLDELLNMNMFFSFFFGSGVTLDTEEFVLVTSRSPRYYVSAAYWDRDSLLWSFPSILMVDAEYAKEMLYYVFTKQIKNIGIHSRYIDGTVLEPGFELDELCAPILALYQYVIKTKDNAFLTNVNIIAGVERILSILATKKHHSVDLYETMLQPTDDMHVYKYITYDNVMVWRMLINLSELYSSIWEQDRIIKVKATAEAVKDAISLHCIKEKEGRPMYAWSVDLAGKWDVYDEPPGSIMLFPYYEFCSFDKNIWRNTVEFIRRKDYPYSFAEYPIAEIGCPHAPHPWILSIANSLLSGNEQSAKIHLLRCKMDNGIACESVDEHTGESRTGEAFATCAGFLAYAIYYAFGKEK